MGNSSVDNRNDGIKNVDEKNALPPSSLVLDPRHADDERFMRIALEEAAAAAAEGEVPIGAVVVHDGEVIARAHNRRELDEDPSAHAEFSAMVAASRALGRWRLTGCTVYVTLEPCLMCAGLMVNGRIDRCVFGAFDPKGGATGTLYDVSHDPRLNHEFEVTGGVLQDECAAQLRDFFRARRKAAKAAKAATAATAESAATAGYAATAATAESAATAGYAATAATAESAAFIPNAESTLEP